MTVTDNRDATRRVVTPIRLPPGRIWLIPETGERFDSDGRWLTMTDDGDACDCPACEPRCRKEGKPCFILCAKCSGKQESDEIGPLTSHSRRVSD